MSKRIAHITQAKHNEQVARDLIAPPLSHNDWSVVAIFYASVHYVEASWADREVHSRSHVERGDYLNKRYMIDQKLKVNCRILQNQGWIARYLSNDTQNTKTAQQFFNNDAIAMLFHRLEIIKHSLHIV